MQRGVSYLIFLGVIAPFVAAVVAAFGQAPSTLIGALLVASGLVALVFSQQVAVVENQLYRLVPWHRKSTPSPHFVLLWGAGVLILGVWQLFAG